MSEPRLSYVIGRVERVLRRRITAAVEPMGLTLPAYTALSVLRVQDGLSNAQLARRSFVTPQSMSEVLALLVERGYVRRRAEPGHGRVLRTELTKAGSRALERCDRAVDAIEREMLGDLDAAEAADLRDVLIRCARALDFELVQPLRPVAEPRGDVRGRGAQRRAEARDEVLHRHHRAVHREVDRGDGAASRLRIGAAIERRP